MKYLIILFLFALSLTVGAQTTYTDRAALAADPVFRGRVAFAMIEAASAVLADTTAESVRNYRFAGRILLEPTSQFFVDQFTYAVLSYPFMTAESPDNDIAFHVNSQFAKLALAFRRERNELVPGEQ